MPRLFWKFFTTIWLTMAATVGVIILLVNFLQGVPLRANWRKSGE